MRGSGSGSRAAEVALDGYCAVCLAEMREWVRGTPQHEVVFDGRAYRFPSREQLEQFRGEPARYAPVLGGDDVVEFANTGRRVPGDLRFGAVFGGRSYFFASEGNKRAFRTTPQAYADADLALGGECVVCRVDRNERRTGSAETLAVHQGMRYRFAGDEQRDAFVRDPKRYVTAMPTGSGSRGASGSRTVAPASGSRSAPRASGSGSGGR